MSAGKKPTAKAPQQRRLTIQIAGSAAEAFAREQAAVEKQKRWARDVADRIERGELPRGSDERQVIAWIVRGWADRPVYMNQSAYARHRGCSRQAVGAAIKEGRLGDCLHEDEVGRLLIDMEAADMEWARNTDADQSERASWPRR